MNKLKLFLVALLILMLGLTGASYVYRHRTLDRTSPVLTTDREVLELSVTADPAALFEGLSAMDNRDGDISSEIMLDHISHLIDTGTVRITYVVFDQADNFARLTRTLRYTDYESPHFELSQPLVYSVGSTVSVGSRLRAYDVLDGNISENIQISTQNLNVNQPGLYTIDVQATNSLGDMVSLPLQVLMVQGNRLPEVELTDYLIYIPQGTRFVSRNYIKSVSDPALSEEDPAPSTAAVRIVGAVDTTTPGVYYVQYYYNGIDGTGYSMLTAVVE